MATHQTCRRCGQYAHHSHMVQYGTRHWMHHACYLDTGKSLDKLRIWQIEEFPYRLLDERGLLPAVKQRIAEGQQRVGQR